MESIGLADTVQALKEELAEAILRGTDDEVQFPVGGVELEFHVGVTKSKEAKGGLRVWVIELAAGAEYATETVQTIKLTLEAPVDQDGRPVKVGRSTAQKP